MNSSPIGVFDSGIGGLSVLKEIRKVLPNEQIVFLADEKNFPYGNKTSKNIKKISITNVEWLLSQKVKIIVVACNTATVNAITHLRKKFPNIQFIGMEPAVKPAAKLSKKGIIILSSPKATQSKQLNTLIERFAKGVKVINIGSLELVKAVEKSSKTVEINNILKVLLPEKMLNQTDTLVLGCTHFPLIRSDIQKYVGKNIQVIDSGEAVAKRLKEVLKENMLLSSKVTATVKYYTSGKEKSVRGIKFHAVKS